MLRDTRLKCPKCDTLMEKVKVAGAVVDRCVNCGAMWFDASELKAVLASDGMAKKLDQAGVDRASKASTGKSGNPKSTHRHLACPRDGETLVTVPDKSQFHIQVDKCKACSGVFLDAGELKDMSEFSLSERVKQFFA